MEHIGASPEYKVDAAVTDKLEKLWSQITNVFKDYNDHLIFEAVNEVREIGSPVEWSGRTEEGRNVLNHYDAALDSFLLPSSKNLMISIHAYAPYNFAMNCYDDNQKDNFDEEDKAQLKFNLDKYYNRFVAKGIPVVIGEMGTTNKNNLQDRVEHAKCYISLAKERHIPCVWWIMVNIM